MDRAGIGYCIAQRENAPAMLRRKSKCGITSFTRSSARHKGRL